MLNHVDTHVQCMFKADVESCEYTCIYKANVESCEYTCMCMYKALSNRSDISNILDIYCY